MGETIWTGKSRYGYECRVVKLTGSNGDPVYTVERNMGKYDKRFYVMGAYGDKAEAINKADKMCLR